MNILRNYLLYPICLLFLLFACKKVGVESKVGSSKNAQDLLSKSEINSRIVNIIAAKKDFRWTDVSDQAVWSALSYSGNMLSIGYKPKGWTNAQVENQLHTIDVQSSAWQNAKKEMLQLVWEEEKKNKPTLKIEALMCAPESNFPVVCVFVYSLNTIEKLRKSELVRYAEPVGYDPSAENRGNQLQRVSSNFGCGRANPYGGVLVEDRDYTQVDKIAGAKGSSVSWNYSAHKIPQAWGISTGKGSKVMVIDTGCSLTQENLQGDFNQGKSAGRTVEHLSTLPSSAECVYTPIEVDGVYVNSILYYSYRYGAPVPLGDACGHGTMMAGVVAAPRGVDGAACGVAYNCDLVTVKASRDVVINELEEIKGVVDAFELAARRDDIKIISMSMGCILYNSEIADAIKKAANCGKLIFCAAGTTLDYFTPAKYWGVVFPANMEEVLAVTGISSGLNSICTTCHDGSAVDFVAVMQKPDLLSLTLATSGDVPAVDGGSSVATAMMAGMTALVWSRYPHKTAAQILTILKACSTRSYRLVYETDFSSIVYGTFWEGSRLNELRKKKPKNMKINPIWGSGMLDVHKAVTMY